MKVRPLAQTIKIPFISLVSLIILALSCAAPSATPPPQSADGSAAPAPTAMKAGWEMEWEKTLEKARKEGRVTVYSTLGSDVRNAFVEAFPKATGIELDFVTGRSAQISQKITTERNAGLNLVDIYTGGLNTILADMKNRGYLQPIKPTLILPEVKDPTLWFQKELPFTDTNGDTIFSFRANPGSRSVTINTGQVKKEEVSSFYDLLNPKWKGKIALNDVTTGGSGQKWVSMSLLFYGLNPDYMKQLAKQEPFMTRDERLQMEWIARGRYPIGIATSSDMGAEFRQAGAPILEFSPKEEKLYISTGGGNIVLIDKAPHPSAAKIFINWLLSREGQTIFSRARQDASARVDVPTNHLPDFKVRDPNYKYLIVDKEDILTVPGWIETQDKAREIFGHLLR